MLTRNTVIALMAAIGISGCATMQEKQVHETPAPAADVSKSVQAAASAKDEPAGLKRKVAIGRFTNETRYGQSFFVDADGDRIGKQAMDILSSKLFETGRFIMLERADLDKIQKELAMGEASKLKNSADYLILGSITEFGRKEVSDVGFFSRVKKQEAFARVHIRIVDVSTGQIIYSEEGKGTAYSEAGTVMGVGDKSAYDSQLNDKAIDAAISDLASNIIENMTDRPWRGYLLGYEDGLLITSGGKSQNIKAGDRFDVMAAGKRVKNPQTNSFITLPGKKLATVVIVSTSGDTPENEVSFARITAGSLGDRLAGKNFSDLYIQVPKE